MADIDDQYIALLQRKNKLREHWQDQKSKHLLTSFEGLGNFV